MVVKVCKDVCQARQRILKRTLADLVIATSRSMFYVSSRQDSMSLDASLIITKAFCDSAA